MRLKVVLALAPALALVPTLAAADPKLTLEQVIDKAVAGPRGQMAEGDRRAAAARVDEADAARLPTAKLKAFGTISPEIDCANADCTETSPTNFAFRFKGLFGSAELDITQPLYTFGKIGHARTAARAGLDALTALADETAGDVASDAARAYWGLKLARELGAMLDDGIEEIGKASEHLDERKDLSVQDRQRVKVLLAEAKVQRSEAAQGEAQALAGLRALVGAADADIDDAQLAATTREVPKTASGAHRPQVLAAASGAHAADELADFESSKYFPDFALVGSAIISRAQGATDPPSAYANDPYNQTGAGVVVALQWMIEPWTTRARTNRARAEAHHAHAQADLAVAGARYDADSALAEAAGAHDRVDAAAEGEKAARTWLAAVLQNEAIGLAEPRDLADSYLAWFTMRARWANAVFQWNVAVVRLDRATGEFHAGGRRPKE